MRGGLGLFSAAHFGMTASSTNSHQPNIHVDATTAALTRAGRCLISKPVLFLESIQICLIQYFLFSSQSIHATMYVSKELSRLVEGEVACLLLLTSCSLRLVQLFFSLHIPLYQFSPTFCNRQVPPPHRSSDRF